MEDAFDCDGHRVKHFNWFLGFSQDTYFKNYKVKNLFCQFNFIFVFTPADMHENLSFAY